MREPAVRAIVITLFLLMLGWNYAGSEGWLRAAGVPQPRTPVVDFARSAGGGPAEGGLAPDEPGPDTGDAGASVERGPASRISGERDRGYEQRVGSFVAFYGNAISETSPLVHGLLMQSEGVDRMTETEVEELGDLLSELGGAPDSAVIGSYPEGYAECDGYLREGATSLRLAADSVRGFNESADMEYLRDYRRLVSMYMRAAADAQWCVSDHLHRAYP
jgi:hypothetical protein